MMFQRYCGIIFVSLSLCILIRSEDGEMCSAKENGEGKPNGESKCGCAGANREKSDDVGPMADDPINESPSLKYSENANVPPHMFRTHQMAKIPGGKFIMGTDEPHFHADGEQPARWVKIDAFYMDVYEVSNAEFQLFVQATNHKTEVC